MCARNRDAVISAAARPDQAKAVEIDRDIVATDNQSVTLEGNIRGQIVRSGNGYKNRRASRVYRQPLFCFGLQLIGFRVDLIGLSA